MASILARNGFYHAQYTDRNGKIHRRSTKIRVPTDTKTNKSGKKYLSQAAKNAMKIAQTWEQQAKGNLKTAEAQAYLQAAARMVEESSPIATEWLLEYEPRGGEQNKLNAKRAIKLFIDFLSKADLPNIRLSEIKKDHCMKFLGLQLRDNNLASGTVSSYKNHLSRAFRVAIEAEVLNTSNPFTLFRMNDIRLEYTPERKGNDKTQRLPFTADELRIILTEFPQPFRDLAAVSFYCGGQRIGDCISLQWGQVDFVKGTITFLTQKTGAFLEHPLLPELRVRLEKRYQQSANMNSPYVFPELVRQAGVSKGAVSTRFTTLLGAFGISTEPQHLFAHGRRRSVSTRSFHSLRHSAVSILRARGVSAEVSRAVVGHESEAVERGYLTLTNSQKMSALEILARSVQGHHDS